MVNILRGLCATIEIDRHVATVDAGEWTCDEQPILARLQSLESRTYLQDAAAEALGGKIISADPEEPEEDDDGNQLIY